MPPHKFEKRGLTENDARTYGGQLRAAAREIGGERPYVASDPEPGGTFKVSALLDGTNEQLTYLRSLEHAELPPFDELKSQ